MLAYAAPFKPNNLLGQMLGQIFGPKGGKMAKKITELYLKSLKPGDDGATLQDDGSISGTVRAGAAGKISVSFRWRYRFDGKTKDIRIGTWPKTPLAEIRKARDQARRILEEGKDPALERKLEAGRTKQAQLAEQEELARQAARVTVQGLFDRWVALELAQRKESSRAETVRTFKKDVLPAIGDLPADEVTRAHIMGILDGIKARGANRAANLMLTELRQMFGFAYVRDIVKADPTHRIKKADVGGRDVERERVLSEDEIRELARKLPASKMLESSQCAVWIMLSTGCRVGDLIKATWAEVDFEVQTWTFQPEKDMGHIQRTHTVNLSGFALAQFERLHRLTGSTPWLYPDSTNSKPVCKKSITKQVGDRQRTAALRNRSKLTGSLLLSGGPWTPHDLRRTAATLMRELGASKEVADRALYHIEQDKLARIYQRHDVQQGMAEAWRLLGNRLELLTREDGGGNVLVGRFGAAAR